MQEQIFMCARLQAKKNTLLELHVRLLDMVAKTRQEAGNLFYNLHVDIADPTIFYFFEGWVNQAALDSHNATSYVQEIITDAKRLTKDGIRGEVMSQIA
jgi:quinol monooxygenase YgiN